MRWIKWTVFDTVADTLARLNYKSIGILLASTIGASQGGLYGAIFTGLVLGAFMIPFGLIGALMRKKSIWVKPQKMIGSIVFGIFIFLNGTLYVWVFLYPEADLSVVIFISSLSVIPGALLDRLIFKKSIEMHQWACIVIYSYGVLAILDFPDLSYFLNLPTWLIIAIALPLIGALKELITKLLKSRKKEGGEEGKKEENDEELDSFVHNFWIAVTRVTVSFAALVFMPIPEWIGELPTILWAALAIQAVLFIGVNAFMLISYQQGADIAIRSVLFKSLQLTLSVFLGALFFNEVITLSKIIGVLCFLYALLHWEKRFYLKPTRKAQ